MSKVWTSPFTSMRTCLAVPPSQGTFDGLPVMQSERVTDGEARQEALASNARRKIWFCILSPLRF